VNDFPDHLAVNIKNDFPRLYDNVCLFWGAKDFHEYVNSLTMSTHDRTHRQGFPANIIRELLALHTYHDQMFPQFHVIKPWDIV